jgi:Tol biopolymer transport system component
MCVLATLATPAFATFPGRPGLIAFDCLGKICTGSAAGDRPATELAEGRHPTFSPDGSLIAFADEGKLTVMNADGSDERVIYKGSASVPSFDAEGEGLFFDSVPNGEGYTDIYWIPLAGGAPTRLTHSAVKGTDGSSRSPQAAADGRYVAFEREQWIWTMRPDGSDQRRLTPGSDASISPDSKEIVVAGGGDLVVIGAGGGHKHSLQPFTFDSPHEVERREAVAPAFSPDGRSIAFTYQRVTYTGLPGGTAQLAVFTPATDTLRILHSPKAVVQPFEVDWQPLD